MLVAIILIAVVAITTTILLIIHNNRGGLNMPSVEFREIDLSEPYWSGRFWDDVGVDIEKTVDLSQFANQTIESKEMAESIANVILEQEQDKGFLENFVLRRIEHDPIKNIWIFRYDIQPSVPGMSYFAAVDGDTSQLLRMWVDS